MIFRNYRHRPKTLSWANRPFPANGLVVRFEPLVVGQPYFYMEGDGGKWRPLCGAQVLYTLGAAITLTDNAAAQLALSVPLPAGLLPDQRAMLRTVLGAERFGGVTDSLQFYQRMGPLASMADSILFQSAIGTTVVSSGVTNQASRISSTSVQKHGAAGASSAVSLSVYASVARNTPQTVADMDTTTNYFSVWGDLATGGLGEYGQLHSFTLELIG